MAAASSLFISALRRYGERSAANKAKLEAWRDAALESIAENQGGDIASGSMNGSSFAKLAGGAMTNADWFAALSQALNEIESPGGKPPSTTYVRII